MSFLRDANLRAARVQMRFKEKELTYALHPVFDPVVVNNRRVAHVAV